MDLLPTRMESLLAEPNDFMYCDMLNYGVPKCPHNNMLPYMAKQTLQI